MTPEMAAWATSEAQVQAAAALFQVTADEMRTRHSRYLAASEMVQVVCRPIGSRGNRVLIYPDHTCRDGYVLVDADSPPLVGALVRYGTGGINHGMVATVSHICEPYEMESDIVVTDEYHAYSGQRKIGADKIQVCRVYLDKDCDHREFSRPLKGTALQLLGGAR